MRYRDFRILQLCNVQLVYTVEYCLNFALPVTRICIFSIVMTSASRAGIDRGGIL